MVFKATAATIGLSPQLVLLSVSLHSRCLSTVRAFSGVRMFCLPLSQVWLPGGRGLGYSQETPRPALRSTRELKGAASETRTRVFALKGRCPEPLDDDGQKVPMVGVEPTSLTRPPPQDGVYPKFHHIGSKTAGQELNLHQLIQSQPSYP
jgi:hypothetical protein